MRLGVWKERFEWFLPLVINENHARRALPVFKQSIEKVFSLSAIRHEKCTALHVLSLISNLMNSMALTFMRSIKENDRVVSDRSITGYCAYHHLLLYHALRCSPEIRIECNRRVNEFMADATKRSKKNLPNLGEFLINMVLSSKGWEHVRYAYLRELFLRNVRWYVRSEPLLDNVDAKLSVIKCPMYYRQYLTVHQIGLMVGYMCTQKISNTGT